jgi:predicted nucleotide-binding protein (sugar kinase/HSP70/actin superfamily)
MIIERNKKEVIIRLPASVDTDDLQDFLNYARYKELTSGFSVAQKEVDKLATKINSSWWTKNKKRLSK